MKLVLDIRVFGGMNVQRFVIPLDLTGPASLTIKSTGQGYHVGVLDEDGELRVWFAHELVGLRFEGP